MVSAKALIYNNQKTFELIDLTDEQPPIAVQLFGSEPEIMAQGAKIAEEKGADIIDINMGCPVPKVVTNNEGSALMRDVKLASQIVEQVAKSVQIPVTVKIRKGWDENSINAVEFAQKLEEAGAKAIAVHGRTRCQFYSGTADWNIIKKLKKQFRFPLSVTGIFFRQKMPKECSNKPGVTESWWPGVLWAIPGCLKKSPLTLPQE